MSKRDSFKAEKASRDIRKIRGYASDITKCLEGMPCQDCRKQVITDVSLALRDIETEQRMMRLAMSRFKALTKENNNIYV